MIARIGGIVAPLLAGLSGKAPLIIMGGSSLVGGLLAIFLPETLGAKLPETIAQVSMYMFTHFSFNDKIDPSRKERCYYFYLLSDQGLVRKS